MIKKRLLSLLSGCLIAAGMVNANARTDIDVNVGIVSEPPAPQIVVGPPMGYTTCYMTRGMWEGNIWIPRHQECAYPGGPYGSPVWISGYWACVVTRPYGRCGHWRWFSARWRGRPYYYRHAYNHYYGPGPGPGPYEHRRW